MAKEQKDTERGVYTKYFGLRRVDGTDGPGQKHEHCQYFILDLTHDPYAQAAIKAYIAACICTHPHLASDLEQWLFTRKPLVGISGTCPLYKNCEYYRFDTQSGACKSVLALKTLPRHWANCEIRIHKQEELDALKGGEKTIPGPPPRVRSTPGPPPRVL